MGQAKDKKKRLGGWYGRPVVPGHPDYREPEKKPGPTTHDRAVVVVSDRPRPVLIRPGTPREEARVLIADAEERRSAPKENKRGLLWMSFLLAALTAGMSLPPEPRR